MGGEGRNELGGDVMHAERCPVCQGVGRVCSPPPVSTSAAIVWVTCPGCWGRGWVEVSDNVQTPKDVPYHGLHTQMV